MFSQKNMSTSVYFLYAGETAQTTFTTYFPHENKISEIFVEIFVEYAIKMTKCLAFPQENVI